MTAGENINSPPLTASGATLVQQGRDGSRILESPSCPILCHHDDKHNVACVRRNTPQHGLVVSQATQAHQTQRECKNSSTKHAHREQGHTSRTYVRYSWKTNCTPISWKIPRTFEVPTEHDVAPHVNTNRGHEPEHAS